MRQGEAARRHVGGRDRWCRCCWVLTVAEIESRLCGLLPWVHTCLVAWSMYVWDIAGSFVWGVGRREPGWGEHRSRLGRGGCSYAGRSRGCGNVPPAAMQEVAAQ